MTTETTASTSAPAPAPKPAPIKSFRATGSNGSYSYGDTPRQAAQRFFERFDTKRQCSVIEGVIERNFFTVRLGRGSGQYWETVTKGTLATLPG